VPGFQIGRKPTARLGNDLDTALLQPSLAPVCLEGFKCHPRQLTPDEFDRLDDVSQARSGRAFGHSEHLQRRRLDTLPQNPMQAAPCHDVGFAPKDARRSLLHIDQLIKPDRTKWVIEKKINIGIFARIVARGRAEQEQPLDAEPLQLSFVLP
jgi:hypothetical protein